VRCLFSVAEVIGLLLRPLAFVARMNIVTGLRNAIIVCIDSIPADLLYSVGLLSIRKTQ
jgi:hypothetical protein